MHVDSVKSMELVYPSQNTGAEQTKKEADEDIFTGNNKQAQKEEFDYNLDDGKISFKDGLKSFFSGMGEKIKEQASSLVSNISKHPVATGLTAAGAAAVGILSFAFPPLAIAVGVVGAGLGLYQTVKAGSEIYNASKELKNSTTDDETRQILQNMGGSTTEAIEGIATTAVSGATIATAAKGIAVKNALNAADKSYNSFIAELETVPFEEITPQQLGMSKNLNAAKMAEAIRFSQNESIMKKSLLATDALTIPNAVATAQEAADKFEVKD